MKTILIAAAVAALSAGSAVAQDAPQAGGPATDLPLLAGAIASPDCGNLNGLTGKAFCVSAPLASMQTVGEAYIAHFAAQGWETVLGEANYLIFARRRSDNQCEGMQMIAFYDDSRPDSPTTPGYLGFGTIPAIPCQAAAPTPAPAIQ